MTLYDSSGKPPDVKLPDSLESLPRADHFPSQRHRWNTNEEIATILISFEKHQEWLSNEVKSKPKSGSMLLYSRKKVRYRRDNYCWKKRKDGKTTREDHMKLKVQGVECIYGCYVHSAILPTFHRRCYWLLQNSDIVMVHYLNVPSSEGNQIHIPPSLSYSIDRKELTKEELISQLKPMFYSENEPDTNNEYEISTAETIQLIVEQLMEKHQNKTATVPPRSNVTAEYTNKKGKQTVVSSSVEKKTAVNRLASLSEAQNKSSQSTSSGNDLQCIATIAANQPSIQSTAAVSTANVLLATGTCSSIISQGTSCSKTGSVCHGTAPLILNLSQLQGGRSVLILNNNPRPTNDSSLPQGVAVVCNQDVVTSTEDSVEKGRNMVKANSVEIVSKKLSRNSDAGEKIINQSFSCQNLSANVTSPTLDLTQEDIQQTLSANLPVSSSYNTPVTSFSVSKTSTSNISRDPMDFIDSDINTSPVDEVDDVLVNLDAFDMLADFPEFENLFSEPTSNDQKFVSSSNLSSTPEVSQDSKPTQSECHSTSSNSRMDYREGTANITDFSPEWSYTEGGVKVLVTGPWYSSASPYTVLFDGVNVPTTLVQSGVLRCFCPAHEEGLVQVQVACEGFVISNAVIFEYKTRPQLIKEEPVEQERWHSVDENILRVSLMERLDQIEKRLCLEPASVKNITCDSRKIEENKIIQKMFEDNLVSVCRKLMDCSWKKDLQSQAFSKKMTILHLAAALGYNSLLSMMLKWKQENSSLVLEMELDALSRDEFEATPLLWACAKGNKEAAVLLCEYNKSALHMKDTKGNTPLMLAFQNGDQELINYLQLAESPENSGDILRTSNVHDGGRKFSLDIPLSISTSDFDCDDLNMCSVSPMFSSGCSSPRPALSKLSSVDSGINLAHSDSMNKPAIKNSRDYTSAQQPSRLDRSMSLPVSATIPFSSLHGSKKDILSFDVKEDFPVTFMDIETSNATGSPYIDVVGISDEENESKQKNIKIVQNDDSGVDCKTNACVLTLAEQIIAALPDRIKATADEMDGDDVNSDGVEKMHDEDVFSSSAIDSESMLANDLNFQFESHSYRYVDMSTPTSSLSPASSTCIQSPGSLTLNSPSPPPTTADFCEFFKASGIIMEKDFSNLTLSDKEQRELYEAAKIIQKAYRNYKGRKLQEEQEKERAAAVLIQSSYRRYKQYIYFKRMTKAAVLIQNHFRSYCENKSFKKTSDTNRITVGSAPSSIQQHPYCRMYKEQDGSRMRPPGTRESTPTPTTAGVKRTYSQRRQNQAARKIQQFMRQSKNNSMLDILHEKVIHLY